MKQYTKWMALAMAFTLPATVGIMVTQPALAAQEQAADDTLFLQCKNKITSELAAAGVISRQNAEIIKSATVKGSKESRIDVNYIDGKLSFSSSPLVMERLQKNYPNNNTRVAEEYVLEVAEAVGEADMWLRTEGNGNVGSGTFTDWSACVAVSVKNLLLRKNISEKEATGSLMASGSLSALKKYVQWDNEKKVITLNESLFAKACGLATDAEIESLLEVGAPEQEEDNSQAPAAMSEAYAAIPETMRNFWDNLKPLENKQDLQAFKKTTWDMCQQTVLLVELGDVRHATEVPFEALKGYESEMAAKGAKVYYGPSATVRVAPAYIEYYNDVIVSRLRSFFEPLSKDTRSRDVLVTVGKDGEMLFNGRLGGLVTESESNVQICQFKDIKKALTAQEGTELEATFTVFNLPPVYSPHLHNMLRLEETFFVYCDQRDESGNIIKSGACRKVAYKPVWYEAPIVRGVKFDDFYIENGSSYHDSQITIRTAEQANEYEMNQLSEANRKIRAEEGTPVYAYALLILVICLILAGPFMGYVIYQEKKREWVTLPMPEGTEVKDMHDVEALREEFNEYNEWLADVELLEEDGGSILRISEKKVVDNGYKILHKLAALPELNTDEILALNLMGRSLNVAQKRERCSSRVMLYFIIFVYLVLLLPQLYTCFSSSIWLGLVSLIPSVAAMMTVTLAELMPTYKFANGEPAIIRGMQRLLRLVKFGGLAAACTAATTPTVTIYKDSSGRHWIGEKDYTGGCLVSVLILCLLMFILPFLAGCNTLVKIFRNYVSNK